MDAPGVGAATDTTRAVARCARPRRVRDTQAAHPGATSGSGGRTGGRCRWRGAHTPQRPIVVVESRERIERDLDGLAWLPEPVDPDRPFVLLDTETTGLGSGTGTLPFLVGVGTWEGESFVTRQLLLPEQSDEAGYLDALEALIPPDACLVSYNGRSFDWPLLVTRYRLHGRRPPPSARTSTCCRWRARCGSTDCRMPAWPAWRPPSAACGGSTTCPAGWCRAAISTTCAPVTAPAAGRAGAQPAGCRLDGPGAAGAGVGAGAGRREPAAPRRRCIRAISVGSAVPMPANVGTRRRWPASMRPWSDSSIRGRRSTTSPSPSTARGR